jgi:hypothetical protein
MTGPEPRLIKTDAGPLELVPATIDDLRSIARYWPWEVFRDDEASGSYGGYGLVFQHGTEEIHGVKLQPPDIDAEEAKMHFYFNRALIASALPHYLEKQHLGVMVPCAYYKEKAEGKVETGVVFFVGPDPASKSTDVEDPLVLFDDALGAGATPMIFDMVAAFGKAGEEYNLPPFIVIGMERRPRLAVGGLAMHFIVAGPRVIVVKDPLNEEEPVWGHAVRAGLTRLPYAPMKPAAFAGPVPASVPRV